MSQPSTTRRFKVNPIEVAILSVVATVFFNSLYHLVYREKNFQVLALSETLRTSSEANRSLASVPQAAPLLNLNFKCGDHEQKETSSERIRLFGTLCGLGTQEQTQSSQLKRAEIINISNRYNATVFTELPSSRFSTDYIQLETGKNTIHFHFSYLYGASFDQDLLIIKKPKSPREP